jgi:hypothetical protein
MPLAYPAGAAGTPATGLGRILSVLVDRTLRRILSVPVERKGRHMEIASAALEPATVASSKCE